MKEFPYSHGDVFFIDGVSMVVEDAKKVDEVGCGLATHDLCRS